MKNGATRPALTHALESWAQAVGQAHVVTGDGELARAGKSTYEGESGFSAILRPSTTEEVQNCLRIANRFGIPVYPTSSGKNWGYGSRLPARSGGALLDLGRMKRIVDFDEDLAYITVEPGVTQQEALSFLRERGSRLWLDATGASPEASLVGNTVERGFGHTPYGDHFAHSAGFQVVLPTGGVVETGFSGYPNCKTGPLHRSGVGPAVDGLFTQSSLGVVTRLSLWLMPAPEYFQAFFFTCEHAEDLEGVIDALRPLRLNGTLRSTVHVGNDYKVLSGIRQYPWEETGGATPLTPQQLAGFRKRLHFGCWNGSGGMYGTRGQVAEARRLIRRALQGRVSRLQFLDERMLELATRFAKPYRIVTGWDLRRTLELARPVFNLMRGRPSSHPLSSTYWRKRSAPPADGDPDRDGCGLIWFSPVAPFSGAHARRVADLASQVLQSHGFEPMISISMVNDRSLACVVSICYDRDVDGEDERARRCHAEAMTALMENGYPPYRLSTLAMPDMQWPEGYRTLIRTMKKALDPEGILSPGRYIAH